MEEIKTGKVSPLRKRIKFWLTVSGFGAGIVFLLAGKAAMNYYINGQLLYLLSYPSHC